MDGAWLGMYVHMHWSYDRPYAARTWTLADWRAYLEGIHALGYNLLQIWPMTDTMPLPPTSSDAAHLDKLRQVIDLAHDAFGMTVWVTLSPNAVGNERAAAYTFEDRPYFACERLVNPGDPAELDALLERRRILLSPLREADGFSIIDADPGGYEGSTVSEFVDLLAGHRQLFDELRPGIRLNYWMWWGWRDRIANIPGPEAAAQSERILEETLTAMQVRELEPWGVLACKRQHIPVVRRLGLQARTLFYPYGAIESEPSVPWTNNNLQAMEDAFQFVTPADYPLGAMGNAQTHVFQLPHTYYFAQIARARGRRAISLKKFAEELVPGYGAAIADAWQALAGMEAERLDAAHQRILATMDAKPKAGRLSGLVLHDPERFLGDLACQLRWQGAAARAEETLLAGGDVLPVAESLHAGLARLVERTGFRDYYGGAFVLRVHPILARLAPELPNPAPLQATLEQWNVLARHHGPERHGYLARLVDGLEASLA